MNRSRLLIVEDEAIVARDLEARLCALGYVVVGRAGTGAQALALTREHLPDLVLMDIHLQGDMDGIAAAQGVRRDHNIPVIFLTAYAEDATLERAKAAEPFGYILKPAEDYELRSTLEISLHKHRAETALRESQERLAALFERGRDAILVADARTGTILEANGEAERLLQRPRAEIIGKGYQDLHPPEQRTEYAEAFEAHARHRHMPLKEAEVLRPNGERIPVEVSATFIDLRDGRRVIQGIFRDITERKRTEARLRLLSRAVEQSPASIVITDPAGRIEYVNARFCEITGYTADEVRGRNPRVLKSGRMSAEEYAALWDTLKRGEEWRGEFENRRKDGEIFWELASISPIVDAEGRIQHYLAVKEDITERKRAEAELHETNRLLEEATSRANELALQAELASLTKSQFLANMSHEIRTPMNGILGMTGLLLDTSLTPDQRQYATLVRSSGQALLSVINDILDFSKIEARRLELETLDFDLRALLEETADLLAIKAAEKGLDLACLVDPAVPQQLRGDPGRVRQILLNLAGNAIKFTASGEVLIRVSLETQNDWHATLRFAVSDTGIGIPPDRQHILFAPFTQVDGSTTRKFGGTGLGLAISRQLAELMGGQIGLVSQEGRGSTFWFTANFEKQPGSAPMEPDFRLAHPAPSVLIVEAHAATRESLSQPLRAWGFTVQEAADAAAAWSALTSAAATGHPFRLAFVDSRCTAANGRPLHRAMLAEPTLAGTRVLLLTPLGQRAAAAAPAEKAPRLSKPLHRAALSEAIERALNAATAAPTQPEHDASASPTACPRQNLRILLAEDNATNQLVALSLLKKFGCQADVAANGLEALAALRSRPYDLVLMDCQMPELDGFEATRQIRQPGSGVLNPSLPIIAMTAHAMDGDRANCLAAGMDDYIPKPVDPDVLRSVLNRWAARIPAQPAAPPATSAQPAPAPALGGEVFDRTGFLRRIMGDTDLALTLVEGFLADLPAQIEHFNAAVGAGDLAAACQQAHRIKGSSANMGGLALQRIAAEAEAAAKSGRIETLLALRPQLAAASERFQSTLRDHWKTNAPLPTEKAKTP